jgi:hypothetical protein
MLKKCSPKTLLLYSTLYSVHSVNTAIYQITVSFVYRARWTKEISFAVIIGALGTKVLF